MEAPIQFGSCVISQVACIGNLLAEQGPEWLKKVGNKLEASLSDFV